MGSIPILTINHFLSFVHINLRQYMYLDSLYFNYLLKLLGRRFNLVIFWADCTFHWWVRLCFRTGLVFNLVWFFTPNSNFACCIIIDFKHQFQVLDQGPGFEGSQAMHDAEVASDGHRKIRDWADSSSLHYMSIVDRGLFQLENTFSLFKPFIEDCLCAPNSPYATDLWSLLMIQHILDQQLPTQR